WAGEIGRNELQLLNLSHNFITVLPQFQWYGLTELYLQSNLIEGPFPPSICSMSGLDVLDMSHNSFDGAIPQCQLPTKYFQNFNFMKNVVKDNREPRYLDTRGKYYSFVIAVKGVDQDITRLLVSLTIIDLSNNSFERGIPEIIGSLNSLKVLNLSHNSLNGRIPDSLGKLSEIESLDLSSNQLTGNIPKSLAGIKCLEVLNLSQNHLVGHIPEG
nr:leucine-rich repeat-containing protein [Tanacetum cinerariifolium]